jgi:hypothetical protein
MKYLKKIRNSLLILSVLTAALGQTAFAEYTYTIRVYAGNQGSVSENGITIPAGASMSSDGSQVEITGLKYGEKVYITVQDMASAEDSRYYVKGLRKAGRDNSEAENVASVFDVEGDRDYVVAYGIKGDMVAYTINYVDGNGNALLDSDTYYGNPGERQYVSARYVDGYQPQAYNLVKTLSDNTAENVFNFEYARVTTPAPEGTGTETATPAGEEGTEGTAPAGEAGAEADAGAAADAGVQEVVPVEDEQVPEDLVDLDDEDTPLANQKLDDERPGTRMGYLPVYVGIGAAALTALILAAFYLRKRRSIVVQVEDIPELLEDVTDINDIKDIRNDE